MKKIVLAIAFVGMLGFTAGCSSSSACGCDPQPCCEPVYVSPCCPAPSQGMGYDSSANAAAPAAAAPAGGAGANCGGGGKACG
jgi:hypothetical protein